MRSGEAGRFLPCRVWPSLASLCGASPSRGGPHGGLPCEVPILALNLAGLAFERKLGGIIP